jgi:hypothetical protein
MRTETDPVSETSCILTFRIPDDGQSPEIRQFWELYSIVKILQILLENLDFRAYVYIHKNIVRRRPSFCVWLKKFLSPRNLSTCFTMSKAGKLTFQYLLSLLAVGTNMESPMMNKAALLSGNELEVIFSVYWRCSIDRSGRLRCMSRQFSTKCL